MIGVLLDLLGLATLSLYCDHIMYQGQCADLYSSLCGIGQRLYLSPEGEGYCDCDEVRDEGKVLQRHHLYQGLAEARWSLLPEPDNCLLW